LVYTFFFFTILPVIITVFVFSIMVIVVLNMQQKSGYAGRTMSVFPQV